MSATFPFQGLIVLEAEQLRQMLDTSVEQTMRRLLDEREKQQASATDPNEEVSANEAARILGYKTTSSLRQWHGNGLTVIIKRRRNFYRRGEVVKLNDKLSKKF